MLPADRIADYLKRLTPQARSNLLNELERLQLCGADVPGNGALLESLRAEFRKDGQTHNRMGNPSRYFFAPLEPFLMDGDPDYPNPGRISRGSLSPIWDWISRDLLPTMARDYAEQMRSLIASDKKSEAQRAASTFQTKVIKSLENTFASADATEQARAKLATYTASRAVFGDLGKMVSVLRAREALARLASELPEKISKFDDGKVASVRELIDAFVKTGKEGDREAVPFALTLVANRLKTPWQLIRFATKAAASKAASDVAATPYAVAVTMVLDLIEDKKLALHFALRNNRVLVARELLVSIYDTEYALQVRIDNLEPSDWGVRLHRLMEAIAALVEAEVSRFPGEVGHVLGSSSLRSHQSFSGRLTHLAWKGRDAMHEGAAFFKGLMGQS
ncbi:hypothetical protein [Bradyrhizobium sp. Tv2a-2]|uniref:hypothetical protein n=1 Tax=Bradyrhizobium sp. Tv2a-2 TaxID=113395 RepID=UPI0003F901E1|nr:hypothetical protein [Bradyrhizobium sp. Tv2a-2]